MALPQQGNVAPEIKKGLHSSEQELPVALGETVEPNVPERTTVASVEVPLGDKQNLDLEKLNAIRTGPLTAVTVPVGQVDEKTLAEIKHLLFPKIDFEKENPTPLELVNYLLVNHDMQLEQAHDWIAFLASNSEAKV